MSTDRHADPDTWEDLVIDATEGGAVCVAQFINFERFSQIGAGAVQYVAAFRADTFDVSGGTVAVGETLASDGAVTITSGDAVESVLNDGTIAGSVCDVRGNDRVVNVGRRPAIIAAVLVIIWAALVGLDQARGW